MKRRSRGKRFYSFWTDLPKVITVVSLIVVVLVVGSVLLIINQTPKFPDISYVPKKEWGGIDWSNASEKQAKLPDFLETFTESTGTSGESWGSTAPMSKAEKYDAINKKYKNAFSDLKKFYEAELNRLMEHAKMDYQASKNGTKDIAISALATQYLEAGKNLEKDCDFIFNSVLEEMKRELAANGLPADLAKQAENEYKAQKSNMRVEIISRGLVLAND